MKLIAIETATEACSVALSVDGAMLSRHAVTPRRHAELVLPWIDELLASAGLSKRQLDAIAVGRGPGGFTGVRLGVALAQGIALALDRPLVGVSTLAALACAAPPSPRVLAVIDARMGEVYHGLFDTGDGLPRALADEGLCAPDALVLPGAQSWVGVGSGLAADDGALRRRLHGRLAEVDADALPQASDVARIALDALARGEGGAPEAVQPAYLRDKVAQTLAERGLA